MDCKAPGFYLVGPEHHLSIFAIVATIPVSSRPRRIIYGKVPYYLARKEISHSMGENEILLFYSATWQGVKIFAFFLPTMLWLCVYERCHKTAASIHTL